MPTRAAEIVDYWLALPREKHFAKDPKFDAELRKLFADDVARAQEDACDDWRESPLGAMALVLLLDQINRNIHRDTPQMFAGDSRALAIAETALSRNYDLAFETPHNSWFYMPFMHSENRAHQERCVGLFYSRELTDGLEHALAHAKIIQKFGRFPHRNKILARESTEAETQFLQQGGFAG